MIKNFERYLVYVALAGVLGLGFGLFRINSGNKFAYIDSSKVMLGFNEASRVKRELDSKKKEWDKDIQGLKDTLSSYVSEMSKEYDNAPQKRKRELQDKLAAQNKKLNNYQAAKNREYEKLNKENMKPVIDKINMFLQEYGKKHGYDIIFGTSSGGSILFGSDAYDITEEVINGLNQRYK